MKTYKVKATYVTECHVFIDAESVEEALQIARDMDGGQFEAGVMDDWHIEDAVEVSHA